MKASLIWSLSLLTLAAGIATLPPAYGGDPRQVPPLETALKQRAGRSIVMQPVTINPGQSLTLTHTRFGDGNVKKGQARGVQLVIYSTSKDETGGYPVLHSDVRMVDRSSPLIQTFSTYTHPLDAEPQSIIAVLLGLQMPNNDPDSDKTGLLPRGDSITGEIRNPGTGTALLLPAVQKVREAAAK